MKCIEFLPQKGFSLIDLSVSVFISASAISLGGFGIISIMSFSRSSVFEIEIKKDAAQALEFIASEARQSQTFETDPKKLNQLSLPSSPFGAEVSSIPGNKTPVVVLEFDPTLEPVIYFLAPAASPWQGQALYRWGPPYDESGEYNPKYLKDPSRWTPALLIDQISQGGISPDCQGWQTFPEKVSDGFYACIEPNGQIAEFVFYDSNLAMELRAKAFARSN